MRNIKVLDTTLRDGGRVIDCHFPDNEILDISKRLAASKIDIIEVGFLRDWRKVNYQGNSTFFTSVDQMKPFIDHANGKSIYVAFIDYGLFDFDTLPECDGTSIDGIRFGFTKKNYLADREGIIRYARLIKDKGYMLFLQGVNSLSYNDRELLDLVDVMNEIHPYSFGIVDTYGAMYIEDVDHLYSLIDHNLDPDICINFHSHNNYQLSFAFSQEVIKLSRGTRNIIIDSTLQGMGKLSGNLNTELIINYLVQKMHYDYEMDEILDLIDDYIYKYSLEHKWGYSTLAMLQGYYMAHQNNVIYLTEKFRLSTKDVGRILAMIDPQTRLRYDYDVIEERYIEYSSNRIDDSGALAELKALVAGRPILVISPGASILTHEGVIEDYIRDRDPIIISVNFVDRHDGSLAFFGNIKRYNRFKGKTDGHEIITSSNIRSSAARYQINYDSIINRGYAYFDNSTIMLLNLLKKLGVERIALAGFDGFDADLDSNYIDDSFQNDRHKSEFERMNLEISRMMKDIIETLEGKCSVEFITPSKFQP